MADAAAPTRLWSRDYVFDIGVNFLVYSVHFLLMLWSTAYAIYTWNASISMAGLASGLFIVGACSRASRPDASSTSSAAARCSSRER